MFFIGLDLGQRQDFSAWAIIEPVGDTHWVRHLERAKLGTPYSAVVARLTELTTGYLLAGRSRIVVDATGVGAPVVEMMRQGRTGAPITAVTITGGDKAHGTGENYHVPKQDLMGGLQVLLEQRRLKIHQKLKEAPVLARELSSVRRWRQSGTCSGIGAEGHKEHDDLAMAVALACWRAQRRTVGLGTQRLPGI